MALIIAIAGPMRSGKSTLAAALSTRFDIPVVSYAEAVRQEVSQAFFPKQQRAEARFLWDILESQDKTLTRPILQAWGQGRRDLVSSDYWVNRLMHYIEKRGYPHVIIDDLRYPNEAESVVRNGGFIIRLSADNETLRERGAKHTEHPSEDMEALDTYLKQIQTHVVPIDTSGRSDYGLFKAAQPFVEEWLE